jgi:hypothetical protein
MKESRHARPWVDERRDDERQLGARMICDSIRTSPPTTRGWRSSQRSNVTVFSTGFTLALDQSGDLLKGAGFVRVFVGDDEQADDAD